MIFQFAFVLAVAWVTAANPLAVYSRQSTNFECADLPTSCSDALKSYTQISRPGGNTNPSGIANATQTSLGVLCSSECLGPFLRCAGTQSARDLIIQVTCARDEDGNFCLSKVIREVVRGLGIIPPSNCTSTCSEVAKCQSFHRQLQNGLGCCVATLFTSPFYSQLEVQRSFAACNASLGNPCVPTTAAGAAIVYLNVMLVLAAMFLVSFAIM